MLQGVKNGDSNTGLKLNLNDLSDIRRQSLEQKRFGPYRAELRGTFAVKNKWLSPANKDNQETGGSPSTMVVHKHKGVNDAASALDGIHR